MAGKGHRSSEDTVEYYLFPSIPNRIGDDEVQAYLEEQVDIFLAHLSPFLIDYIWQCEPFTLSPVVGKGNLPPHLYSSTSFGENIDDEWFIVYLLFRLSRAYPSLVIKTSDNDGEFLLIEAAEALPKWLTPETSDNRVYIYQGDIHIIPIPQTPAEMMELPLFAPDIPDGVNCIREHTSLTRASPQIQRYIFSRLSCFPEKIKENVHHTNCYIPAKLVPVLRRNPALVAPAVHAFYYRDPLDLQACRTMQIFSPTDQVLARVKLTRCLYAQLMHQQFTPDKRSGYTLPASSNPKFQSHDLGMKLAHGFEILCTKCSSGQRMGVNGHTVSSDRDVRWQRYLKSLNMSGYFRDEVTGSKLYTELLVEARKFYMDQLQISNSGSFRASPGEEVLDLVGSTTYDLDSLRRQEQTLASPDDDSWLNLTPESLDEILKKASGRSDPDAFDMTKVADSMKTFVGHVSGVEGAEFPQESEEGEIQFESTGFIHAMQKMFEFNDEDDASSSDEFEEYDWDDSDDDFESPPKHSPSKRPHTRKSPKKAAPRPDPKIQNVMDMMDRELAQTNVGKSFERETVKQNGNTKPKPQRPKQPPPPRPSPPHSSRPSPPARPSPPPRPSQRPPQRPPPRPNNTPTSSPRKYKRDIDDEDDGFVPVNINLNVVKNTLESYTAQQGLPGPASNILHSMGVKLPPNADAL
ncbi:protein ecdysoneless homolog [Haliotis rufescens]|uniref:protein ecdysoneless homolog n=1 Tax=Haliotis rufescens TaxID=6454 RepID=UPI001EAFD29C|nr:protein ecdysoneless homolog [Haliotis rufescens]